MTLQYVARLDKVLYRMTSPESGRMWERTFRCFRARKEEVMEKKWGGGGWRSLWSLGPFGHPALSFVVQGEYVIRLGRHALSSPFALNAFNCSRISHSFVSSPFLILFLFPGTTQLPLSS